MFRSLFILVMTLMLPLAQSVATSTDAGATKLANLQWKNSAFTKIEVIDGKRIVVVDVPPESKQGQHFVTAPFDLTTLPAGMCMMSIRARWKDVSEPPQKWLGTKFMLEYTNPNGIKVYPSSSGLSGSSDWVELSRMFVTPEKGSHSAKLNLGLQDSSGHIEFDLGSLEFTSALGKEYQLMKDYKITYPDRVANDIRRRGVMSPHKVAENDMKTLKAWNVNLVRYQISRNFAKIGLDKDLDEYDKWIDSMLEHGDDVLKWATEQNIKVVIDLHTPPGGWGSGTEQRIFRERKYFDHYLETWRKIARRYKGNPTVWGYDLINEPNQIGKVVYSYWTVQQEAAKAIREIDPDTTIIVESNGWDGPSHYKYLVPLDMDNVIYQVHMYAPGEYTHQGVHARPKGATYPGIIGGVQYDQNKLREILQPVRDFQLKHNARIYVGEFSAAAWAPNAEKYLADCIGIFEEYGWDWSYHAFRESPIWNVEKEGQDMKSMRPSADNPRKRVLLEAFKKNQY